MSTSQYGTPFLIDPASSADKTNGIVELKRLSMFPSAPGPMPDDQPAGIEAPGFDEAWLQDVLFRHPQTLPVDDVDPAYRGLVSICTELPIGAGAADILYATRDGRLVIVETKLWRNHSARRAVVSQILEYAAELVKLSYEDLSTTISKRLKTSGDELYRRVKAVHPDIEEPRFIDNVAKTLRHGRFLLLIVGDGIREGAEHLIGFMEEYGSMEFSFGLIEVGVYADANGRRLFHPRVLAKTLIIKRTVVSFDRSVINLTTEDSPGGMDTEPHSATAGSDTRSIERQAFYRKFWGEFVPSLKLDDTTQPMPKPTKSENIYLALPPSMTQGWISAYFSQSRKIVGVYMRFASSSAFGDYAYQKLLEQKAEIDAEIGPGCIWASADVPGGGVGVRMAYDDLANAETMARIERFFRDRLNRFVLAFRPRLVKLAREFGA